MTTHRITVATTGQSFDWPGTSTILAAALGAGIPLSYECASGGCGMCKARLDEGEVDSLWPDATGLSARDLRRGDRVLLCQSVPRTDCVIQAAPLEGADGEPPVARRPATVTRNDELNETTRLVELDVGHDPLDYLAGQFVLVELPDGVRRAYSMSRPAERASGLEVVVRAKPGGAATAWFFDRLSVGDRVTVEGPYGKAYHRASTERPVVGIAGGSGLGPVLTIADHALSVDPDRPVTLYFGCRRSADLFFTDRLTALAAAGATVEVVVEDGAGDDHRTGLVGDVVDADWDDLTEADVYLAGPTSMVDDCLAKLVRTGKAAADRVFFDRFV